MDIVRGRGIGCGIGGDIVRDALTEDILRNDLIMRLSHAPVSCVCFMC